MPELPEVETVVRELRREICGEVIQSIEIFRSNPIIQGDLEIFSKKLCGTTFIDITRRAKFLIFHLQPQRYLIAHLRMTGKFIVSDPITKPSKYNRVWFHLKSGRLLIFDDVRCFGTLEVHELLSDSKSISRLGIEPLSSEMNPNFFVEKMKSSTREIKIVLLDQKIVAGLGNIYVSEILYRARIHPKKVAGNLLKNDWIKIIKYCQIILEDAILNNGTTISDFRRVDEKTGKFQNFLKVYGKIGEDCPICNFPIQRIVQQQRSTFFCQKCQK